MPLLMNPPPLPPLIDNPANADLFYGGLQNMTWPTTLAAINALYEINYHNLPIQFAPTDAAQDVLVTVTLSNLPSQVAGCNNYFAALVEGQNIEYQGNILLNFILFQNFCPLTTNIWTFGWWAGLAFSASVFYACQYYNQAGFVETVFSNGSTLDYTPMFPVVTPPVLNAPTLSAVIAN